MSDVFMDQNFFQHVLKRIEPYEKKLFLVGLRIWCAYIIFEAFFEYLHLIGLEQYFFAHQDSPLWFVYLRYAFSVLSRLVIIITCVEVMFRRELFRKILIAISVFTILTVYWRHPYQSVVNVNWFRHTSPQEFRSVMTLPFIGKKVYTVMFVKMLNLCIQEIVLNSATILLLTNKKIKRFFRH